MAKKKKKTRRNDYTKRLMTELQSTVAYGVYDSPDICGLGDSVSQAMLRDKLVQAYFPSDLRLSHVELFLGQEQKYKYLFEEGDSGIPTIPEKLHRLKNREIGIEKNCINTSMLTRKNKSNTMDISSYTLFRNAKEVEANTKKAFAIKRLKSPGKKRDVDGQMKDLSGMGNGNDVDEGLSSDDDDDNDNNTVEEEENIEGIKRNGRIPVHSLSRNYFRKKLIRHFNICFHKNELQWPERIQRNDKEK